MCVTCNVLLPTSGFQKQQATVYSVKTATHCALVTSYHTVKLVINEGKGRKVNIGLFYVSSNMLALSLLFL